MKKENLKRIDLIEYKELIKEMLNDFHLLCMKNQLKYFVAYGTLIGAVRHNGFIPWDDDVDVCMPREDYEKLIKIMDEHNEKYYMLTPFNSRYYFNNFSRFCSRKGKLDLKGVVYIDNLGPFIDVIPLDRVPDNQLERSVYYKRVREYFESIRYSLPSRYYRELSWKGRVKMHMNIPKKIINKYFVGLEKLKEQREKYITQYNSENTGILCGSFDRQSDKLLIFENEIEQLVVHKFEDINILIPAEYDAILTRTYGDYMKYPPVELQVAHHHFIPYWNVI